MSGDSPFTLLTPRLGFKLDWIFVVAAIHQVAVGADFAAQRQPERAAQLFGAAEVLHKAVNQSLPPVICAEYDRNVSAARQQMDEAAFQAAWAEGRAMTLNQALERALEADPQGQAGLDGL